MKRKTKPVVPLAVGQLWKLDAAYVQVFDLGKRLVHYKLLKQPGQKAVRTQTTAIGTLEDYLKTNKAMLVESPAV